MENIKDFDTIKENWVKLGVTWEDKLKFLESSIKNIMAKLDDGDNKPDRSNKKNDTALLLKTIVGELRHVTDAELREEVKVLHKTFHSMLPEIYKMPGGLEELLDLLESYPDLDFDISYLIRIKWYDQSDHYMRELLNKDSTPEQRNMNKKFFEDTIEKINKVKVEADKQKKWFYDLFELAQDALALNDKHVSSSSEKKYRRESSSRDHKYRESSSRDHKYRESSSRDHKRARK